MGRKLSNISIGVAAVLAGLVALAATAVAAPSVATSFNTGFGLVSVAWDPATGNVFAYKSGQQVISEFTPSGTLVDEVVKFPGQPSDDVDIDFADSAFSMGRNLAQIPAGSLLLGNGDDTPETLYAMNKDTGEVLATLPLQTGNTVGLTFHGSRGTFYVLDYANDVLTEVSPTDGTFLNTFPVAPSGSPQMANGSPFDVFYGDVDVHPTSGNLFVAGSSYMVVRELTPTGGFVRDIDLTALELNSGVSGLAFDSAGDLWLTTTSGYVYKVTDLLSGGSAKPPPPECSESDSICTGDEDDTVDGTSSSDFIWTAAGDDVISAGGGSDTVDAGAGHDSVGAGPGADHVFGGSGDDTIRGDSLAATHMRAAQGESSADTLEGGSGEDTISGEAGGDKLDGGADGDSLNGGGGSDSLKGGGGRDVLRGAQGFDLLNGGAGRDTCFVDSKKEQRRAKNCERFRRNL